MVKGDKIFYEIWIFCLR